MNLSYFSAPLQCAKGNLKHIYDQATVSTGAIQVSVNMTPANETMQILKPAEGLQFSEPTTVLIELTPVARVAELQITLEAQDAEYVTIRTDCAQIAEIREVRKNLY